jgi:hypothetical protein
MRPPSFSPASPATGTSGPAPTRHSVEQGPGHKPSPATSQR